MRYHAPPSVFQSMRERLSAIPNLYRLFSSFKNGVFCYNTRNREMLACKGISLTGDELRSKSSKTCWNTAELLSWYHLIKNLSKVH